MLRYMPDGSLGYGFARKMDLHTRLVYVGALI